MGIIVAITYKDEQNIFIKLQIYFIPRRKRIFCGGEAAIQVFYTTRLPSPRSLIAFGTCYFARGKTVLFALCLSLSRGAAASSYHKKPPGASQLLFSFPCLLIDLEYKVPIWAGAEFVAAAKTYLLWQ